MSEEIQTDSGEEPAAQAAGERKPKSRSTLISGAELGEMPFVSQRDYNPTPYVDTTWEIDGLQVAERDFMPLEVNIVHEDHADADPMFEVFDKGIPRDQETMFYGEAPKKKQAEAPVVDADLIAAMEAEWQVRVEEAKQAGFQEGVAVAEASIAERYEQLTARVKSITDAVYQQWSTLAGTLERNAVELSLQVSKKILSTTADVKPEYIITVIREALAQLGAAKPVRIRVSHEDYEFLHVIGLPLDISAGEIGVTYLADDQIKSGCIVETDFGEVDLVLDRMWEQVKDSIYGSKK